jgi:hypothetical protein
MAPPPSRLELWNFDAKKFGRVARIPYRKPCAHGTYAWFGVETFPAGSAQAGPERARATPCPHAHTRRRRLLPRVLKFMRERAHKSLPADHVSATER